MTRGQRWLFRLALVLPACAGLQLLPARWLGLLAMGGALVSMVGLAGAVGEVRRRP